MSLQFNLCSCRMRCTGSLPICSAREAHPARLPAYLALPIAGGAASAGQRAASHRAGECGGHAAVAAHGCAGGLGWQGGRELMAACILRPLGGLYGRHSKPQLHALEAPHATSRSHLQTPNSPSHPCTRPPARAEKGGMTAALAGGVFDIGDRVVAITGSGSPPFGSRGTVVGTYDEAVEVRRRGGVGVAGGLLHR